MENKRVAVPPKTGKKGLIDLKVLSPEQLKQYESLVEGDSRNEKAKKRMGFKREE